MKDQEEKTSKFWDYLASRYSYVAALHDWRWVMGGDIDFELFQDKYLTPTDEYAGSVICAKQCIACGYRRVIELYRGGYEAVCKKWSNDAFEIDPQEVLEYTVLEDELVADIAKVLEITPYTAELVFCDNSWKVGNITVRGESHSVFLTLQWGPGLLELILQLNRLIHNSYVLLGTSEKMCGDVANGCLADGNAVFVPLNETLDFNEDAELELMRPFDWEKILLSPEALTEEPDNIFRRCGDAWEIRYDGGEKFMLTTGNTGATYLHYMLARPNTATPVLEIIHYITRQAGDSVSARRLDKDDISSGYSVSNLPNSQSYAIADDTAIMQYEQEISTLLGEIAEAEDVGDNVTAEQLQQDLEEIEAAMDKIESPIGQRRMLENSSRTIENSFRNTINRTIKMITEYDSNLFEHLKRSVSCGANPVYAPTGPISWEL